MERERSWGQVCGRPAVVFRIASDFCPSSFTFGSDVVSRFLAKHDMDLICRAHQVSAIFRRRCAVSGQFTNSHH